MDIKPTLYSICTIGFLALISSCDSDSSETQTGNQGTDLETKMATEEEPSEENRRFTSFPAHQSFYTNLLSKSSCTFLESLKDTTTGPVECSEFKSSIAQFGTVYESDGQLDYYPSKIPLTGTNNRLVSLIDRIATENRYGLVFHYGFENDKIVYILSKGQLDNDGAVQYCPFEDENDGFFALLQPNGTDPFQEIDGQRFESLTQAYFTHMRSNEISPPSRLDPTVHAKMVYHRPDSLMRFFEAFNQFSDLHLYINHGVVLSPKKDMFYHVPILTIGDQNVFYEIDNTDNSPNVFYKKALDVGRICPPNCPKVEPNCN